ncbi:hypothetical protein [Nocardiopsis halophila]|uniref:hypothetical protein n=1 Tax=Nocardiopsis halophila TaxID=141692 RepID=UPI000346A3A8|nr:hypothetical protein [Nocardiopsis halophila]
MPPNSSVLEISYSAPTATASRDGAAAVSAAYLDDRSARVGELIDARLAALEEQTQARTEQMEELAVDAAKGGSAKQARAEARLEAVQSEISDLNAETGPLSAAEASLVPGQVLTPAAVPESPSSPQAVLWVAAGGMLGLAAGAVGAFALERRARGRAEQVEAAGAAEGTAQSSTERSADSAVGSGTTDGAPSKAPDRTWGEAAEAAETGEPDRSTGQAETAEATEAAEQTDTSERSDTAADNEATPDTDAAAGGDGNGGDREEADGAQREDEPAGAGR